MGTLGQAQSVRADGLRARFSICQAVAKCGSDGEVVRLASVELSPPPESDKQCCSCETSDPFVVLL